MMKCWLFLVFLGYLSGTSFGKYLPPGGLVWINCTRPNEYYDCGSACQTECATLGQPCPIINVRCNDDCYCMDGYARDDNGVCIRIEDCPAKYICYSTYKK
ncbi:inducible metalloproteinase inhibitor protein-like [Anoplophora glabripennis]|uniref:inducible metalloproteinase inhibitor protein-like n=1 Tax=Anoplophora glabripennis TaxID=217634 RepID=UPI000874629A|nr:inducible metalloproteinase inhibitor protein-like [Anoplophora glabripennis]